MRASLAGLALALLVAMPLRAQAAHPTRFRAWAPAVPVQWADTTPAGTRVRPTRWKEGMLIGGGIGVALGVMLAIGLHDLCDSNDCPSAPVLALEAGAVLGLVGAVPGALIGGAFPAAPDSTRHER